MNAEDFRQGSDRSDDESALRLASVLPSSRPLLASEALKDDLAPMAPLARTARSVAVASGATVGVLGFVPGSDGLGQPWAGCAIGLGMAGLGVAPLLYRSRAAGLLLMGALLGGAGLIGAGPANIAPGTSPIGAAMTLLAGVALPAALLFRSHYRAYRGARALLALALLASVPVAVQAALALSQAPPALEFAELGVIAAVACGLVGFMGAQAPLSGGAIASALITALVAPLAVRNAMASGVEGSLAWAPSIAHAAGFAIACGITALGSFQQLAARHWVRARAVDVHPPADDPPPAAPSAPSLTDSWADRS